MQLKNKTKDIVIGDHVALADTFWKRLKGLLGTSCLPAGHGLLIKPCSSVHTFGMRYPIDVLFVDKNHKIVKIAAEIGAGKGSMASGGSYVVELPAGTARQTACTVGDILEWQ